MSEKVRITIEYCPSDAEYRGAALEAAERFLSALAAHIAAVELVPVHGVWQVKVNGATTYTKEEDTFPTVADLIDRVRKAAGIELAPLHRRGWFPYF